MGPGPTAHSSPSAMYAWALRQTKNQTTILFIRFPSTETYFFHARRSFATSWKLDSIYCWISETTNPAKDGFLVARTVCRGNLPLIVSFIMLTRNEPTDQLRQLSLSRWQFSTCPVIIKIFLIVNIYECLKMHGITYEHEFTLNICISI